MRKGPDQPEWEAATWAGNRRLQHEAFKKLSLREKVLVIEQMSEVSAVLEAAFRKRANAARPIVASQSAPESPPPDHTM